MTIVRDDLEHSWVQRYRPQSLSECILPANVRKKFATIVKDGKIPNLLLHSETGGIGKTTVALALCNELGANVMFINGSNDRNIDTIRTTLTNFCGQVSIEDTQKVVIIDESDNLNRNSSQPALRAFIEEFSKSATFIFTANYKNRLMPQLQSRFAHVDFDFTKQEEDEIKPLMVARLVEILKAENVKFDLKSVVVLLNTYYPDFRRVINQLQFISNEHGEIRPDNVQRISEGIWEDLVAILKQKNQYSKLRMWVAENASQSPAKIVSYFYNNLDKIFDVKSHHLAIVILDELQNAITAGVINKDIAITRRLAELMIECEFK